MSRSVERRLATQYPDMKPETVRAIADQQQKVTAREAMGDTLKRIVELGAKATKRPWAHFSGKLRPQFPTRINEILAQCGVVVVKWAGFDCASLSNTQRKKDAAYITEAANHADLMAAKLLAIERLCEEQPDNLLAKQILEEWKR